MTMRNIAGNNRHTRARGWMKLLGIAAITIANIAAAAATKASTALAFPGAQGWAAHTPGGRGGQLLRVTTLRADGPGSLRAAIETPGPRTVVFEVGGVIDLDRRGITVKEPFLTLAGQTAPSPGITLIRGGLDVATHDVVIRHLRVRVGSAGVARLAGWEEDAFSTRGGAHDVIVDHCSFTWATDENLSASGPRFTGSTPAQWRRGTSYRITYSNNLIAEGLANAGHSKGEHSKGSLIHDNVEDILIVGNLYAHNYERNPLLKGGVRGVVINNLIYDPGQRAVHYNLIDEEWGDHPRQVGRIDLRGNVVRAGPSTPDALAVLELGGSGDLEVFAADNLGVDRIGRPLPLFGRYTTAPAQFIELKDEPTLPEGVRVLSAAEVQDALVREVGARPWDRDPHDARVVADTIEGRGHIIDNESEVGGYPAASETHAAFDPAQWDLDSMTAKHPPTQRARPH